MPEFHLMLVRGRRWWARAGQPLFPVIAGGDGTGDPPGGAGDPPGGDPPSLEQQADTALEKLDKGEVPTEAERSALRKVRGELKRARDDAGRYRGETKTEKDAREKAEKELQQLREKHEPDQAKLEREKAEREAAEKESRARDRRLADAERDLRRERMRNLFTDQATSKEVNGRLAWPFLAETLKDVDPADEAEAKKAIAKALDQAVKDEPGLKLAKFAPSGGGEGFQGGGGGNGKAKTLDEAVTNAYRR